jgi:hypothetical protein
MRGSQLFSTACSDWGYLLLEIAFLQGIYSMNTIVSGHVKNSFLYARGIHHGLTINIWRFPAMGDPQ